MSLPYAPDWTVSFNPEFRSTVGSNYEFFVGANVRFSDGFWISNNEDPRNEIGGFNRVDLRVGLAPMGGRWEAAIYGRDLTDERLQTGGQPDFQHKTSDPTLQLSDQIEWQIEDAVTGSPRAKVVMRPGDVAAMPADIRHQGFARKRAMLLVWENADPELPRLHAQGALPATPAEEFWPESRPQQP